MSGLLAIGLVWMWLGADERPRMFSLIGREHATFDRRLLAALARRRRQHRGQVQTTRLLQAIINDVRAGILPAEAFAGVLGIPGITPEELIARPPTADLGIWRDAAHIWRTSEIAGFSMALALQRIHAYALSEQETMAEVVAMAAGPRLTTWIMAALPAVVWAATSSFGIRPLQWLTHGLGIVAGVLGLAAMLSGFAWMRWLVAKAMR